MDVAHVGLVHCDPCECKVKGFCAVFSIKKNVSMRHLQGVQQLWSIDDSKCWKLIGRGGFAIWD